MLVKTSKLTAKKTSSENFDPFSSVISALLLLCVSYNFFPGLIPLPWFYWGESKSTLFKILMAAWPALTFGILWTSFLLFVTKNKPHENHNAGKKLLDGVLLSFFAGIVEESLFRWLIFLCTIGSLRISDCLLGGFIFETGLVQLLYTEILVPIANALTVGQLKEYLYSPLSWAVGAAMVSTNWKFSKDHAYQGLIGLIDSWFFGMLMFKVVWECGLPAAIMVHVAYDLIIFTLLFLDRKVEYMRGNK